MPPGDFVVKRYQEGAAQMPKRNFVAMGQAGLTGRAQDIARPVARRTGRPGADILSLIGAASLTIALIGFLRQVDTVIKAGRTGRQPGTDARPLVLGKGNGER
jgi:hypothetical protein